jgi:hypothetical protein
MVRVFAASQQMPGADYFTIDHDTGFRPGTKVCIARKCRPR